MADFVADTVKEIDSRLVELRDETTKLEAARAALVGIGRGPGRPKGSGRSASAAATTRTAPEAAEETAATSAKRGRKPGRKTSSSSRRGPGRPRGSRGSNTRATEALTLVRERPGITIAELADTMKIEPNYLYRVMPRLVADGKVRRQGSGWHLVG